MPKYSTAQTTLRGVKVCVFDLDCTIFDSRYVWDAVDEEFLRKRGKAPTDEYKRKIATLGSYEVAKFTVKFYGLDDTPDDLEREWLDMALHEYSNIVPLFPCVKEYIETIAAAGIRIVAATSVVRELAEPCLKRHGILGLFEKIYTANEMGLGKSSPEFYAHIASDMNAAPAEFVVFDDAVKALRSAKKTGMRTVAVCGAGGFADGLRAGKKTADLIMCGFDNAPRLVREL